jgi:C_GCAxxG_C_C family probable redox protein
MNFAQFDIAERAAFYLGKGFHCSQTVLHVVQDLLGEEDEAAVRMMGGFGAGIGGMGSVCGAMIGGVAALGLNRGKGTVEGREDPSLFPLCAELYHRFGTEIEASHFCRDITGTDFTKPEEVKAYMNSPEKTGRCIRLVGRTAALVKDMLSREDAKSSSAGVKGSSR